MATHIHEGKPMPYLFRNYNVESNYPGSSNFYVWEATRATSAAPIYFEPFCKENKVQQAHLRIENSYFSVLGFS